MYAPRNIVSWAFSLTHLMLINNTESVLYLNCSGAHHFTTWKNTCTFRDHYWRLIRLDLTRSLTHVECIARNIEIWHWDNQYPNLCSWDYEETDQPMVSVCVEEVFTMHFGLWSTSTLVRKSTDIFTKKINRKAEDWIIICNLHPDYADATNINRWDG